MEQGQPGKENKVKKKLKRILWKITRPFKYAKTFFSSGFKNQIIFIKAFIYMGLARFAMLHVPFDKISRHIGKHHTESEEEVPKEVEDYAEEIAEIVYKVSDHTPWESMCLVRALAVQKLLKEKGIRTTVYFGMKKSRDGKEVLVHAWTRCGTRIITGKSSWRKETINGYKEVARFAN